MACPMIAVACAWLVAAGPEPIMDLSAVQSRRSRSVVDDSGLRRRAAAKFDIRWSTTGAITTGMISPKADGSSFGDYDPDRGGRNAHSEFVLPAGTTDSP